MAQWGAVLGLATYALVYGPVFRVVVRVRRGKGPRPAASTGSRWMGYTVLLGATTLLLLLHTFGTVGGRIGGSPIGVSTFSLMLISSFWYVQIVAFFFLGFVAVRRSGFTMLLAVVVYVAYAAFETLEGNRGPAVSALIMFANGAVWAGFSVRKAIVAVAASVVLFLSIGGVVDLYRSVTTRTQYDAGLSARAAAFSDASDAIRSRAADGTANAYQAVIYAASAIVVDQVMILTPDVIPYARFEDLSALFYIYVPKVFAPNRPEIDDGNLTAAKYGSYSPGSFYYTPSVGEGYRRFGWLGIPIMYGLSALVFGTTLGLCWAKRHKRAWMALLAFLVTQAPGVWGFTLNYLFYFALFYVPKYYLYFLVLSAAQDVLRFSPSFTAQSTKPQAWPAERIRAVGRS